MRGNSVKNNSFGWIFRRRLVRPVRFLAHYGVKDYRENKERAHDLVKNKISFFNQSGEYQISRVSIKNQKTRWGSCSGKRNLSFNYKIVFLPEELQDYLIVHELSHLKEMNHSRAFWNLVAAKVPDHKARRAKIREY